MKQTSRKKVLLSSVAMMMVATVSLGSATYAWFTNNTKVTADNMKVKASASQGLQITIDNGNSWGPAKSFEAFSEQDKVLSPVSVGYTDGDNNYAHFGTAYHPGKAGVTGKVIFEGEGKNDSSFTEWTSQALPAAPETDEAKASNGYFAVYEVGVKTTVANEDGTPSNVKMTVNASEPKKFMRVAVLENGKTENTYDTAVDFATDTIYTVMGDEANAEAITSIDTLAATSQKVENVTKYEKNITVGTNAQYYTILVWYEGQDTDCVDTNQGAEGTIDVQFDIV